MDASSITISTLYAFPGDEPITISTGYTFAMAKHVYVQVTGIEKTVKIEADAAEETGKVGSSDFKLIIKLGGKEIGKFRGISVDGWWIQDE